MYDKFEKFGLDSYPPEIRGRFNSFITTQFDDSLSVEMQIRSIIKWAINNFDETVNQTNSLIDFINDLIEYMNNFIETFDSKLTQTVVVKLNEWLDDGTLADIINNDVFDMKADKSFVDSEIERLDQKDEDLTTQLTHTERDLLERGANPINFGADPNGIEDSTQAFKLAEAVSKSIVVPTGKFLINNLVLEDETVIYGSGKRLTHLVKNDNGFMIDLGRNGQIKNCHFDGKMNDYTGQAIIISRGDNVVERHMQGHQLVSNCSFDDVDSYHIEYTELNKGWLSTIFKCDFGATNADAAVKWPDEPTNGGNRSLLSSYAQYPILNVGGADNGFVSHNTIGGTMEAFIFPADTTNPSKKIIFDSNRMATHGGTTTVRGIDHVFTGNIIAGSIVFDESSDNCRFENSNILTGDFLNKKVTNSIFGITGDFVPEWLASTTNPDYGNSDVRGFWKYEGKKISVDMQITFGSTVDFGVGAWQFKLPKKFNGMTNTSFTGSVFSTKGNGTVYGTPETDIITLYRNESLGTFNASSHAWESGDRLVIHYEYTIVS